MEKLKVKIKKLHPDAVIPFYAKPGDAGMDLTATSKYLDENGNLCYGIGLAFEIPEGYVGLIFPRSSLSNLKLDLANVVGLIDSGYRGEVTVKFKPTDAFELVETKEMKVAMIKGSLPIFIEGVFPKSLSEKHYEVGDRIAQIIIMPYPLIEFEEAEELSKTERGTGGYGHTGLK